MGQNPLGLTSRPGHPRNTLTARTPSTSRQLTRSAATALATPLPAATDLRTSPRCMPASQREAAQGHPPRESPSPARQRHREKALQAVLPGPLVVATGPRLLARQGVGIVVVCSGSCLRLAGGNQQRMPPQALTAGLRRATLIQTAADAPAGPGCVNGVGKRVVKNASHTIAQPVTGEARAADHVVRCSATGSATPRSAAASGVRRCRNLDITAPTRHPWRQWQAQTARSIGLSYEDHQLMRIWRGRLPPGLVLRRFVWVWTGGRGW